MRRAEEQRRKKIRLTTAATKVYTERAELLAKQLLSDPWFEDSIKSGLISAAADRLGFSTDRYHGGRWSINTPWHRPEGLGKALGERAIEMAKDMLETLDLPWEKVVLSAKDKKEIINIAKGVYWERVEKMATEYASQKAAADFDSLVKPIIDAKLDELDKDILVFEDDYCDDD